MTFNQMLMKNGYLEDLEASKERVRPWHIKKIKISSKS